MSLIMLKSNVILIVFDLAKAISTRTNVSQNNDKIKTVFKLFNKKGSIII